MLAARYMAERLNAIKESEYNYSLILCVNIGDVYGKVISKYAQVSKEELASIHSVGEKIAESVLEGLNEKKTLIDRLFKMGVVLKKVHKKSSGALQGKTFLFTGTLSSMPRSEAESLVRRGLARSKTFKIHLV